MIKKIFLWILIVVLLLVVGFFISVLSKKPSLNLNWEEESRILPAITISDSKVEIKNLRDWRYEEGKAISKNYYADTFDLNKLAKSYLLFNPFGQWEGVGHSFLLFEFEGGQTVSVSIEARKEAGEAYDFWRGMTRGYEIWYAIGSAADFMTNRAIFHQEDLYIYPLLISKEAGQKLFLDVVQTAHSLETTPRFYNTITSNCTNLLADAANHVQKSSVPWHYSRVLTGYIDNQLYKLGYIPHNKPFEEIYKEARVDEQIREIFGNSKNYSREEFWQKIKQAKNL